MYVSYVHQLDNLILLGGAGSGAGALKAQVTEGERQKEREQLAERGLVGKQAGRQNGRQTEWTSCQFQIRTGEGIYRSEIFSGGGLSYLIHS